MSEDEEMQKQNSEIPGKRKFSLVIIIIIVLLTIAIGGAIYFFLFNNNKKDSNKSATETQQNTKLPAFLQMEEFILDLTSTGRKNNFLKLKVSLEIENQKDVEKVNLMMPRVRDIFQTYLRNLREDDLRGNTGIELLREELLLRVNKIVYPAVVSNILFSEIVVN